jgi:hypothetical protein
MCGGSEAFEVVGVKRRLAIGFCKKRAGLRPRLTSKGVSAPRQCPD